MLILPHLKGLPAGNAGSNTFKSSALDLNFSTTKSLVDSVSGNNLVSFTRVGSVANAATFVDSSGVLQRAVTNLLLRSEEFNDASWTKLSSVSVSANTTLSPTETLTADTVTADSGAGIYQNLSCPIGATYTNSVYVKAGTATAIMFRDDTGAGRHIVFNPSTGVITQTSGTLISSGSQALSNGWYRYWITYVSDTTSVRGIIRPDSSGSAQTFIVWGAQLEQSSTVGEYIPTTSTINSAPRFDHSTSSTTNLLLRSEEFNNASWTKHNLQAFGSGSIVNAIAAPNGTVTADKIVENTATTQHMVYQSTTPEAGKAYVFSFYAKAAERTFVIGAFSGGGISPDCTIGVNLNTGAVVSTAGSPEFTQVTPIGDGWYRIALIKTMVSATGLQPRILISTNGTSQSYTGDGTSGLFIWGAQLEQSSTVGPYVPTTTAAATSNTTESLGLLVEEARTNSIANNTGVGVVAGTPGTLPTNWTWNPSGGASTQVVGTGTEDGIPYVDVRLFGTTTNGASIQFCANTAIAAVQNQTWTESFYCKLISGTIQPSAYVRLVERSSAGSYLTEGNGGIVLGASSVPLGRSRFTLTRTLANASTAYVVPAILFDYIGTVDFTIRIGLPQLEQGAFATSPILTSTATVTRAADVASITGSNFGTTRTNLLLRSEEFDNASWTKFRGSIAPNAETAPSGTLTADKLVEDTTATNTHGAFQSITVANGAAYTFSCYIKAGERTSVSFRVSLTGSEINAAFFNLSTGVVLSTGSGYTATITSVGANWYRCSVTATSSVTSSVFVVNTAIGTNNSYTGDGTSGIYLWGAMLETGSTATAYIPTTTAAVSVFESSWYNQTEGTVYTSAQVGYTVPGSAFPIVAAVSDGTSNNRMENGYLTSNLAGFGVVSGGVNQNSVYPATTASNRNLANGYKLNNGASSVNGGALAIISTMAVPVTNQLTLGLAPGAGNTLNGHIKRLTYWPTRLSNNTLQQITQ
jgi:hypothetical protein